MISVQRAIQSLSLAAFLVLLGLAFFPVPGWAPVDAFLRLDPLILVGTTLADRTWIAALAPAALILVLTVVLGRFFCGYLCPMGTTLDLTDRLARLPRSPGKGQASSATGPVPDDPAAPLLPPPVLPSRRLLRLKYLILFFILGAGVLGVSTVFLASPLSLATRLYTLLLHPAAALLGDAALQALRPLALHLDWTRAAYAEFHLPRFTTQWFLLAFFLAVFSLARWSPRFWCRCLCPSGALLALVSRRPLIRRTVSDACTNCGACQRRCPMSAIPANPSRTHHEECITCQECVRICPVRAVVFQPARSFAASGPKTPGFSPQRREALLAGLAGAGTATLTYTGLLEVRSALLPGEISPENLLRPPGSLPERDFLARCIRCGLCMRACPSNTLQPIWFEAGVIALFSPRLTPRRGPCEPECTACGNVCPTGAIRELPLTEKTWAKIGTAAILRHKCLAWEWNKKCLVCDEVCPYDAIDLRRMATHEHPVPFVDGQKCSGCGFCEYHCPVRAASAIVVEPMEALRLDAGSYQATGRAMGLTLQITPPDKPGPGVFDPVPTGVPVAPLPDDAPESDLLPPGFTP